MSKVFFNIDDLALLLVISSSLIFALSVIFSGKRNISSVWLTCFLICLAITSMNLILYWSPVIRTEFSYLQPHLYMVGRGIEVLSPPILYMFAKSVVFDDVKVNRHTLIHLTPISVYALLTIVCYVEVGLPFLTENALDLSSLRSSYAFLMATWFVHVCNIAYAVGSLLILFRHRDTVRHFDSNTAAIDGQWLRYLVIGFIALWFLRLISEIMAAVELPSIAQVIGVFSNYALFALVNFLVVSSLTRKTTQSSITADPHTEPDSDAQVHEYTDEQVTRLERTMHEREPFLKPNLTLEELSRITSIPQRTLSSIINRHHEKNFFEYVNEFRVDRAADLLMKFDRDRSVLDVMSEAGFNSKSAFNRFFKKVKGMTPTQYRDTHKPD